METSQLESYVGYHKNLSDRIAPIYTDITSFTNGILSRLGKTNPLTLKVYTGWQNSLQWDYWMILSYFEHLMCIKVPLSYSLKLSEFYVGRGNRNHIWNESVVRQRGTSYVFTENEKQVLESFFANLESTLLIIKSTTEYKDSSVLRTKVKQYEKKFNKIRLEFQEYIRHKN